MDDENPVVKGVQNTFGVKNQAQKPEKKYVPSSYDTSDEPSPYYTPAPNPNEGLIKKSSDQSGKARLQSEALEKRKKKAVPEVYPATE